MPSVDASTKAKAWPIADGEGPSVCIVGAGIGGISLALDLDSRGLTNWMVFEKAGGVGGTWWTNRYPGCRCDVPGIAYSHSRHLNPNWTETHPERAEIQQYWESIAKSQGLMERMRLRHQVIRAEWDEAEAAYFITVRDRSNEVDRVYRAGVLVNAGGMLSTPRYIPLPGQDTFRGTVFHSADWPDDLSPLQLGGKTVVVVGNGCSGVQVVGTLGLYPDINIVSLARQRQWFVPSPQGKSRHSVPHTPEQIERWNRWPLLLRAQRLWAQARMDYKFYWYKVVEGAAPRRRLEEGIGAWMRKTLPEYMRDSAVPHYCEPLKSENDLTPAFGAKRLIYEDGYFAALNSGHAKFVEGRIARLDGDAVVLDNGQEIKADYVVLATGYDAGRIPFEVVGSDDSTSNYTSKAEWKMYRGVGIPGIPNYFTVFGNNMYLNHCELGGGGQALTTVSVSSVLEVQAAYIARLIQAMRDYSIPRLSAKLSAAEAYEAWLDRRLRRMVWYEVPSFWRSGGGAGRIFTHYPGSVRRLVWENTFPLWKDWHGAEPVQRWRRIRRITWLVGLVLVLVGYWSRRNPSAVAAMAESVAGRIWPVLDAVARLRAKAKLRQSRRGWDSCSLL